jgi:hypothetical protein
MRNRLWQWMAMRWQLVIAGALLAVLLLIHITSLRHRGVTTDEPLHYHYGYRVLNSTPQRTGAIDSSTMPFSSVHAITSESLAALIRTAGFKPDMSRDGQIELGRCASVVPSLLLALYVLKWSYELYGSDGALLSLSLFVFDPNLLAHGQLVTADLPAALMITMALYHFWHFLKSGGKGRAVLSAATLGLSQLAKYSCIYLYPIFLIGAGIYYRSARTTEAAQPFCWHRVLLVLRRWTVVTAFFAAVSILMINLGFGFKGIGTPLSEYAFKDPFFKKLHGTPIIGNLPLPLTVPYIQGLDLVKIEERIGQS